jgi:small conductance mechanosensitive channel
MRAIFRSAIAPRTLCAVALPVLLILGTPAMHGGWLAAKADRVTVRVNGRSLFRVGPADTVSAADRALRIERRLATLLEAPRALAPAQIAAAEGDSASRVVTVSGVPVVTVTRSDAEDNLSTVGALATTWAHAIDAELGHAAEQRRSGWGRFAADIQSSVRSAFSRLAESVVRLVPRLLAAVVVLALFWLLAKGARWLMRLIFRHTIDDLTIENLINQAIYYTIWTLGILMAVDALGFPPATVIAGLGLTGLVLGFALKDILSNFVSGILILALRPYELGDQIVVGETEGSVERISLRATDIRTYDGRLVLVPNAELLTSRVTNNTASPRRQAGVTLFLGYEADLPRAVEVLCAATRETEGVLEEPPVRVRVKELGQDDVLLEIKYWTDSRRLDFVTSQTAVRASAVAALKRAGIGLPDPDVRFLVQRNPTASRELDGQSA